MLRLNNNNNNKKIKNKKKKKKKDKRKERKEKRMMLVSAGNCEKQYCSSRSAVSQIGGICIDVHVFMNVICNLASDVKC